MNGPDLANVAWKRSSLSSGNGQCVEVAFLDGGAVALRDSKDHGRGPVMVFTAAEWDAFLGGAEKGEFKRP